MGAWGTGPFDNDYALDYLYGLAENNAIKDDDDDEIMPGSVNHGGVAGMLAATLGTAADPAADLEGAYAAAGLVAAKLSGAPVAGGGTRFGLALGALIDGTSVELADEADPLGLESHCGYLILLRADDAAALTPAALAAVDALRGSAAFTSQWREPRSIIDQLDRLTLALGGFPTPV